MSIPHSAHDRQVGIASCIRPKQLQNSVAGFYSVGLTAGLKPYPGKPVLKCEVEVGEG
jgi:hypothetical protein